jgi:cytoskeletal protein CcmA (bactofilin family)
VVEGEIEGERIEIFGRFHGTIRARGDVQIHAGAEVTADVFTPSLMLEPGAVFEGHCYLSQAASESGVSAEPLMVPIRPASAQPPVESDADRTIEKPATPEG